MNSKSLTRPPSSRYQTICPVSSRAVSTKARSVASPGRLGASSQPPPRVASGTTVNPGATRAGSPALTIRLGKWSGTAPEVKPVVAEPAAFSAEAVSVTS